MNPNKTYLWSWNSYSESGKLLAEALGILRIKHEGSTFHGNESHTVINWGSSYKTWGVKGFNYKIINVPTAVGQCANKISFFNLCKQAQKDGSSIQVPESTNDKKVVKKWLDDGLCVLAREKVEGSGGEGIIILEQGVDIPSVSLYTKYIPKELEFRVYMVGDVVVDVCRKARNIDETPKNWKIRSRDNGFIFVSYNAEDLLPDTVKQCREAMKVTGLDFAGIDVIVSVKDNLSYILEVNTAPWLNEEIAKHMAAELQKVIT